MAAVNMVKDGVLITNVAEYFNFSVRIIQCHLNIHKDDGTVDRPSGSGKAKLTTPNEDRSIVWLARQNPRTITVEILYNISTYGEYKGSIRTVNKRVLEAGVPARKTAVRPLISDMNKRARVQFAK